MPTTGFLPLTYADIGLQTLYELFKRGVKIPQNANFWINLISNNFSDWKILLLLKSPPSSLQGTVQFKSTDETIHHVNALDGCSKDKALSETSGFYLAFQSQSVLSHTVLMSKMVCAGKFYSIMHRISHKNKTQPLTNERPLSHSSFMYYLVTETIFLLWTRRQNNTCLVLSTAVVFRMKSADLSFLEEDLLYRWNFRIFRLVNISKCWSLYFTINQIYSFFF